MGIQERNKKPVWKGNAIEIPLTQSKVALVDFADYSIVAPYLWSAHGSYALNKSLSGRMKFMHNLIMNPPDGMVVDHINRNGTDNRRSNLRICTPAQNSLNKKRCNTKSGYVGVVPAASTSGEWVAMIRVDGATITLGRSLSAVEAAIMYDMAVLMHRDEFTATNFPREIVAQLGGVRPGERKAFLIDSLGYEPPDRERFTWRKPSTEPRKYRLTVTLHQSVAALLERRFEMEKTLPLTERKYSTESEIVEDVLRADMGLPLKYATLTHLQRFNG